MLSHTSGIIPDVRTSNNDDFSLDEFRERIIAAPAAFEPGSRWQYANSGYILLSMIVERVSGEPFGASLQKRAFAPAGMKGASLATPGAPGGIAGYEYAEDAYKRAPYFSGGYGAGAGIASLNDLVSWDKALASGAILRPKSFRKMWSPASDNAGKPITFDFRGVPTNYGAGWFLSSYKGHPVQSHGGVLSGFSSAVDRYPEDDLSIIVLCNAKAGPDRLGYAEVIAKRIADKVLAVDSSPSNQIRELVRRWDDALVRGDVSYVDTILHDDFLYVTPDRSTFSKAQLLSHLRQSGKLRSSISRITVIKIIDDTAIVLAEGASEHATGGKVKKEDYRYTDVFQRKNGRWQAILTQVTSSSQNETGARSGGAPGGGEDVLPLTEVYRPVILAWKRSNPFRTRRRSGQPKF